MCRSSLVCACEEEGSLERRVSEGLPNMTPSPSLQPDADDFKVSGGRAEASSLVGELVQSQLALWTFSLSSILTWLWQSRRRCLLFNLLLLLPLALAATALLSGALAAFVTLGRFLFPAASSSASSEASEVPAMGSWVVKRLPTALHSAPVPSAFLRRRRSLHHQHSLRQRRARVLSGLAKEDPVAVVGKPGEAYFWQRRLPTTSVPTTSFCPQLRG